MIKAIIVEDEPKAAQELKEVLQHLRSDIQVVAILPSVEESIAWLRANDSPDLIFSDIQLADGVSFTIYQHVKVSAPIIFCTAFDEFALKAFEANGIAYLLKPLDPVKVAESLRKYDELRSMFSRRQSYEQQLRDLLQQLKPNYLSTLLISIRDKIVPVRAEEVAFFYYNNGLVAVYLFNHQQYFVQQAMDDLEVRLDPGQFYRVNRQFIIHRSSIQEIEKYFSRKLMVKLTVKSPESVLVSKVKATHFLEWLKQAGT